MLRDKLEERVNTLDDGQWEKACSIMTDDIKANNLKMGKRTTREYIQSRLETCVRLIRTHLV